MDFGSSRLYELELWTSSGVRMADISSLAQNRTYTLERNEAEELSFDLDMYAFEAFAAAMNTDPKVLITPYQTDVLVKRDGQYLFGVQVDDVIFNLTNDPATMTEGSMSNGPDTFSPSVTITGHGYLNLFKDRYVTITYTGNERCFIAGDLITQAQAATNGDVGVTLAATQYSTGIDDTTRTYTRDNVKTSLQNLTTLVDGRFDFGFSFDKQFQCYGQIGSLRTDLQFTYGGPDSNVAGFYMERTATSLFNEIIGLGSGFGADQLVSDPATSGDVTSQLANYLRQDIKQYNSVVEQDTLDQDAAADLSLEKDLLEIPQITVTGKELENVPFLGVGDRIPIRSVGHPFLDINGLYRIEKMTVTIDDNDFENSIQLYFDNYAVTDS